MNMAVAVKCLVNRHGPVGILGNTIAGSSVGGPFPVRCSQVASGVALASRAVVQHLVRKDVAVDTKVIPAHLAHVSPALAHAFGHGCRRLLLFAIRILGGDLEVFVTGTLLFGVLAFFLAFGIWERCVTRKAGDAATGVGPWHFGPYS